MLKTRYCGELRVEDVGTEVQLAGWVDRRRDHGGLIFIDLRDREGDVQVVFNPEIASSAHATASEVRNEYVLAIKGRVVKRLPGTENPRMPTGEIEVMAEEVTILNTSKTPPFYINEETEVDENLRLKYRYLDLRRVRMHHNMVFRHKVVKFVRDFLSDRGFLEVETPMLVKSTPEGARDYLVPSRIHAGKFYALPQSPQQLKQLLMVGGIEKYFQIARCFRDEDTRADRQPEFTQLDIEMSFIDREDILQLMEALLTALVKAVRPDLRMFSPFPRISYNEAMERYGSDKPDLRYGLPINDISDIAAQTQFSVFRKVISDGGKVKCINAPGCAGYSRSQLEELNKFVQGLGAAGLLTIALGGTGGTLDSLTLEQVKSVAAKYLTLEQVKEIAKRAGASPGDLLLVVAGKPLIITNVLGQLRQEIARRLNLADPGLLALGFVLDFPLLQWNIEENRWESVHHPFTMPVDADMPLLDTGNIEQVHSKHYDVICNGYEVGGGSIRIHKSELQRKLFRLLGHSDEQINTLFGHLLEAFEYGAPPHGGIALGLDRLIMLLAGEKTIREVIAFPKNQNAVDLTMNAPAPASAAQLEELHLCLRED